MEFIFGVLWVVTFLFAFVGLAAFKECEKNKLAVTKLRSELAAYLASQDKLNTETDLRVGALERFSASFKTGDIQ